MIETEKPFISVKHGGLWLDNLYFRRKATMQHKKGALIQQKQGGCETELVLFKLNPKRVLVLSRVTRLITSYSGDNPLLKHNVIGIEESILGTEESRCGLIFQCFSMPRIANSHVFDVIFVPLLTRLSKNMHASPMPLP
jgi:hypothetical protein